MVITTGRRKEQHEARQFFVQTLEFDEVRANTFQEIRALSSEKLELEQLHVHLQIEFQNSSQEQERRQRHDMSRVKTLRGQLEMQKVQLQQESAFFFSSRIQAAQGQREPGESQRAHHDAARLREVATLRAELVVANEQARVGGSNVFPPSAASAAGGEREPIFGR